MKTGLRLELLESREVPAAFPAAAHDAYAWALVNNLRQNPMAFADSLQGFVDNTVSMAFGYSSTDPVADDLRRMIQFASVPGNYSAALTLMRGTAGTGPLAWDEQLDTRAETHNEWMRTHSFEHTGQDLSTKYYLPGFNTGYSGGSPDVWGYAAGSYTSWGEDIGYGVGLASNSKASLSAGTLTLAAFEQREAFLDTVGYMIEINSSSLGHLKNLLGRDAGAASGLPNFNSIGMAIDLYEGPAAYEVQDGVPEAYVSTHRLGFADPAGGGGFVAGLAYDDVNGNGFYDVGEAIDARIDVRDAGGAGFTDDLTAANFGAFSGYVNNGSYTITATVGGAVVGTRTVSVLDGNGWAEFTLNSLPATKVSIDAAAGTVTDLRPVVSWGAITGATSYDIRVDNLTTKVTNIFPGATSGTTSWVPAADFVSGQSYRVIVRAELPSGPAAWSDPRDMAIATPTSAGPAGAVADVRPAFQWSVIDNATQYQVFLTDLTANKANIFPGTLVTTAAWTPGADLISGHQYRWTVRALNAAGLGAWSPWTPFTVSRPVLAGPTGTVADVRPSFSWSAVANATQYQVWVTDATAMKSNIFPGSLTTGTAWSPPADLVSGRSYRWVVRAMNATGAGDWSAVGTFTVGKPTLTSPANGVPDLRPTLSWTAVTNATRYQVCVSDLTTNRLNVLPNSYTTDTTWVPTADLVSGRTYRWWVRALNSAGVGVWSVAGNFSIGTPTILAPVGVAGTTRPMFSWSAVAGTASYELFVDDATTGRRNIFPGQRTNATNWTTSTDLIVGHTYRWWVRALNSSGLGVWSLSNTFQI